MRGNVVVITGGTSGIGRVAAERLAALGARLVLVARNPARGRETLERLSEIASAPPSVHYADLSRLSEMKRVAAEVAAAEPRIDVLINNAGALFGRRQVTEDGLELTLALNHVAYFVLAQLLRECLLASAPARVVNTSSEAHRASRLDFNDLNLERRYRAFGAYGRSKLCNILFTRELARRLAGSGVTVNCFHPGFVATRFGDESGGLLSYGVRLAKLLAVSPKKGAETMVYLASSPEVANMSGEYFYKRRPKQPNCQAQDDQAAARLWVETARLAGLESETAR